MKTILPYLKAVLLPLLFSIYSFTSFAQVPPAEFSFTAVPTLLSGPPKAVGAVYRFSLVAPGTDAIVTITAVVNASVTEIDRTAAIGGGTDVAFQPFIAVNSMTTGYAEFNIDFVATGTLTVFPQAEIAVTGLDIDGYNNAPTNRLNEFNQIDMSAGRTVQYYLNGNDITVTNIGNAVRATNTLGLDYPTINTSENVRFTVFKSSVSNVKVRAGSINNESAAGTSSRQSSFYFARFTYSNGTLAVSDLLSFSGKATNNTVTLNWQLFKDHTLAIAEVERGGNTGSFEKIATIDLPGATDFSLNDKITGAASQYYYRLKLYESNGKIFYSKVLRIATGLSDRSKLMVYPTIVSGPATLSVTAVRAYKGTIGITDMTGRILSNRDILVQKGTMVTALDQVSGLRPGNYIVVLNSDIERVTQRIIVSGN
jgi:hypothetical protein